MISCMNYGTGTRRKSSQFRLSMYLPLAGPVLDVKKVPVHLAYLVIFVYGNYIFFLRSGSGSEKSYEKIVPIRIKISCLIFSNGNDTGDPVVPVCRQLTTVHSYINLEMLKTI